MSNHAIRSLYIVSKSAGSGSMLLALGFAETLIRTFGNVAFFRPLYADTREKDPDINTLLTHFSLPQPYDTAVGIGLDEAEHMLSKGKESALIARLLDQYNALLAAYDFVLCLGLADEALARVIDYDPNLAIAKNFSAPVIGVVSAAGEAKKALTETIRIWHRAILRQGAEPFMLFANRCDRQLYDAHRHATDFCDTVDIPVILLPNVPQLDRPNVRQVVDALGAEVLLGEAEELQRIIGMPRIAAMHLEHFLERVEPGDFIIVPADRSDIILGAMTANHAKAFPPLSAILLTGSLEPDPAILSLLESIGITRLPLLQLHHDTMRAAINVETMDARIETDSPKKIATALGVFHSRVDADNLARKLSIGHTAIVTPAMFEYRLFQRAASDMKRIVLPETQDERILRAADILLRRRAVEIVLIGKAQEILTRAEALGLDLRRAHCIDPSEDALKLKLAKAYFQHRKHKGITLAAAYDAIEVPTLFATMLVDQDECDGMVSGATHTTRDTILPALQVLKTGPQYSIVSSCFLMCFDTKVLVYADCAVNPNPTAAQLAEIAIASAETAETFGIGARVAMLSYSSGESGVGGDVEKVREAVEIVRQRQPDLAVDGPMQYDAAIDPVVGKKKMPGSTVAGEATVFIFPDLNTGNNTYKAVQRSAGAVAVGPVLQGLSKPVNDLSRGALVADIVNTVAITAIQAQGKNR